jgi:hypothetical protein
MHGTVTLSTHSSLKHLSMIQLRFRLVAANRALAVLELETFGSRLDTTSLRRVLGALDVRVVSSEAGTLFDEGTRDRFYVCNLDGSPLTAQRVERIHARVCGALGVSLTCAPERAAPALASA